MKHAIYSLIFLFACSESKEIRLQRLLMQGNDMVVHQNLDEAEKYFLGAIKLDSCFADAWNNLGSVYFQQKNYVKSVEYYNRAIACKPIYTGAYFNRANSFYELHEFYNALQDLDKVAQVKPDTASLYF